MAKLRYAFAGVIVEGIPFDSTSTHHIQREIGTKIERILRLVRDMGNRKKRDSIVNFSY